MDTTIFLEEFGHIAKAPGGVARLRDLILELALHGKLVDHNPNDSDVRELLTQLETRRESVLRDNNVTATRKHKNLEATSGPFTISSNWAWEFLAYLSVWPLKDGDWIESKDQDPSGDIRIVQLADVGLGVFRDRSHRYLTSAKARELGCYYLREGDVLVARLPEPLGRACVFPGNPKSCVTVVDVAVCRCDPEIVNPKYLVNCINSPSVRQLINSWAVGTTRQRVATGRLGGISLPVAPIEEQFRIVAKVDELMALCDKMDLELGERQKLQKTVRQSTLQAVATANSPHELQTSWTRMEDNFAQLIGAPEDVPELLSLCVELAVRGLLTPINDRTDIGEVENLVQQLISSKSGKRFAKVDHINEPFPVPHNWRWVIFEDLLMGSDSGWSPKCDAEPRSIGEWGVLKVSAVTWGEFRPEENKRLPTSLDPKVDCEVQPGDFLLSRANTADLIARSVIAPDNVANKLLMSDKIVRLHFIDPDIKEWANLVNNSAYARDYYRSRATGTSDSMRNISRQVIHELPIPLPPKSAQKACLRKLEKLMRLCSDLGEQISEVRRRGEQLAVSAISSLTGIGIKQEEDEPVKVPLTELIAPLRLGITPDGMVQAPLATILTRFSGEMSARDLWQRYGGEIDAFYAQLKTEVTHGWIQEPAVAEMREKAVELAAD